MSAKLFIYLITTLFIVCPYASAQQEKPLRPRIVYTSEVKPRTISMDIRYEDASGGLAMTSADVTISTPMLQQKGSGTLSERLEILNFMVQREGLNAVAAPYLHMAAESDSLAHGVILHLSCSEVDEYTRECMMAILSPQDKKDMEAAQELSLGKERASFNTILVIDARLKELAKAPLEDGTCREWDSASVRQTIEKSLQETKEMERLQGALEQQTKELTALCRQVTSKAKAEEYAPEIGKRLKELHQTRELCNKEIEAIKVDSQFTHLPIQEAPSNEAWQNECHRLMNFNYFFSKALEESLKS